MVGAFAQTSASPPASLPPDEDEAPEDEASVEVSEPPEDAPDEELPVSFPSVVSSPVMPPSSTMVVLVTVQAADATTAVTAKPRTPYKE
jgi:hypothetical protein